MSLASCTPQDCYYAGRRKGEARCRTQDAGRRGCWSNLGGRCFLYLLVVLLPAASAQKDPCWLASLQLRSGPKPVDMVPPFAPDTFAYSATLDFSSTFYDVDALAQSGCEVDSVPTQNVDVEPGASSALTVYAKDPETEERQAYVFTVTRMIGTETTVQALRIAGATLIPEFTPEVRAYAVDLGLGYETIKITYKLMDVGQKLRMTASQQVSAGTSLDLASTTVDLTPSGGFGAETRRLLSTGETQYLERSQSFLIDVGSSRRVTLTLESTDPMQALRGVYTLDVTRAPCTDARPLYSPISRACTVYCPSAPVCFNATFVNRILCDIGTSSDPTAVALRN